MTLRRFSRRLIAGLLLTLAAAPMRAASKVPPFIPMPNSYVQDAAAPFVISQKHTFISADTALLRPAADALRRVLKARTGMDIALSPKGAKGSITLAIDTALLGAEHYRVAVSKKSLAITGATPAAVFRGVMTLNQLLLADPHEAERGRIPAVKIDDAPRFALRALMIDPARNFLPVKDVKRFIEVMAKYKYNALQLHLTDDQGWRIALKSYPQLASPQSYSAADIREIVAYAAEHYIDVIPELDIPGHTAAFLSVYPELGCTHLLNAPIKVGETVNRMLCAANDTVYTVYNQILPEVASLFPSQYIHLGGDEAAVPANWEQCPRCRAMMEQKGYKRASQLMIPFFERILSSVRATGKKPIMWCELNNIYPPADDYLFPYPQDVTLVSWRGGLTPTCLSLTAQSGHKLIMAPGEHAYLDYPQMHHDLPEYNNWGMPITTLEQAYRFDPGYGRTAEEQAHVWGVMGTLWAEAMPDINRVTYMAYPRALALAEAGWTQMEHRDWADFTQRLYPNLDELMRLGISFRVPFELSGK